MANTENPPDKAFPLENESTHTSDTTTFVTVTTSPSSSTSTSSCVIVVAWLTLARDLKTDSVVMVWMSKSVSVGTDEVNTRAMVDYT